MAFKLFEKIGNPLDSVMGNLNFLSGPFQKAQGLYEQGEYQSAIEQLQQFLASQPGHAQALFLLGLCYDRQDSYQDALDAFKKFLCQHPEDLEALYNIARQYLMLNMPDSALGYVETMEMLSADTVNADVDVAYLKASIYEDMQLTDDAIKSYQHLLGLNPGHRGKRYLGELYVAQDDLEMGVTYLKEYVSEFSDDEAEVFLSLQMGKLGQWADVVELCQKIIVKNPGKEDAFNQLGLAYYCLEQYDEAEKELNKALDINSEYDLALNNLGYTLMKLNKDMEALKTFQKYQGMLNKDSEEFEEVTQQIDFLKDKIANS